MIIVGGVYSSNHCGDFKIIKHLNYSNVLIKFIDTGFEKWCTVGNVRKGKIKDKTIKFTYPRKSTIINIGDVYSSNNFGDFTIIHYKNRDNITIKFNVTGFICVASYKSIINGRVKDKLSPNVYGVGFLGVGGYIAYTGRKNTNYYNVWHGMLCRCYCEKYHENKPTYKDCTVCEEWHNFQNFAAWMQSKIDSGEYQKGYHLDKDIRVNGNKIYSPETCMFVSASDNSKMARGTYDKI